MALGKLVALGETVGKRVMDSSSSGSDSVSARKGSLAVVFLVLFIDMAAFGMLLPLVGIYGRHYQATPFQLTVLGGAFSIMQFSFAPIWGGLSDRIGRRPVMLSTIAGNALAFLVFGLSGSYLVLLISRAMSGVFAANISVAQAYVADVTTRENRAKAMGMTGAAIGLGFVFGPPLGGIAAHRLSLGAPGLIAAGLCLLNFVLALKLLKEPERVRNADSRSGHRGRLPLSRETFEFLRSEKLFGALTLIGFITTFAFCHMEQAFSLFLQERFSLETSSAGEATGLLLMWIGVCGVVVQGGLIRRLVPKYGERRLLLTSFAVQALAMILFVYGTSWTYYGFVGILFAVGSGLGNPSLFSLLSKSVSEERQGYAMGLAHGFSSLARAVGPISALSAFALRSALPFWISGGIYLGLFLGLTFLYSEILPRHSAAS